MARSHAKLSCSVWTDSDHRSLSMAAQWLYAYLLAHPKLTIVGVLDVSLARWARQCPDASPDVLRGALDELVTIGHVKVDWDTEELMFRTFTRHDLSPARWNKNLTAGFWRAWSGVESEDLRAEVCRQMPAALWEKLAEAASDDAVRFRRSLRLEPQPQPRSEPQEALRSEPTSTSPSTSPFSQSPSRSSESQSDSLPGDLSRLGDEYEPHPPSEESRAHRDEVLGQLRGELGPRAGGTTHGMGAA